MLLDILKYIFWQTRKCRDKTTINFQYIYHNYRIPASRKFDNFADTKQMTDSNRLTSVLN